MIERQPKVIEKLPILVENQNILTKIQEKRSILPDLSNRPIFVTPSSFMETSTTTSITTTPTPTTTRPTRYYVHSTTQKAKSYNHFSNKKKISDYDPRKARATTAQPYEVRSLLTWWAFANESHDCNDTLARVPYSLYILIIARVPYSLYILII